MPRSATGQIVERVGKDGKTYRSLRFRAYGERHTQPLGVVNRAKAEKALEHLMADIDRGIWTPPVPVAALTEPTPVPTFHEFADEWWSRHHGQITAGTQADYLTRLEVHLNPYFGDLPLDAITFDTVERYIAAKLAGRAFKDGRAVGNAPPLSPRTVNMQVTLLAAILERAVERELIVRNPAKGKGRRVRERAPARSYLDAAGQIAALLDAGSQLDRKAPESRKHIERRAMLATLTFAGLRISELCTLRWRDVDLAGGWITVGDSKTDAGRRRVKIRGALRDELLALRQRHQDTPQSAYVFATASNGRMSPNNFRGRVLRAAVKLTDERLEANGLPPLPDKLTPHSLRRTFCSLLYALGETPPVVMQEMGHTDPGLALKVYAQSMRRGENETTQLKALVEGADWANMGERATEKASERSTVEAEQT